MIITLTLDFVMRGPRMLGEKRWRGPRLVRNTDIRLKGRSCAIYRQTSLKVYGLFAHESKVQSGLNWAVFQAFLNRPDHRPKILLLSDLVSSISPLLIAGFRLYRAPGLRVMEAMGESRNLLEWVKKNRPRDLRANRIRVSEKPRRRRLALS